MNDDFPPLAHSRVESLNAAGLPNILIINRDGLPFQQWDQFRSHHYLGISAQKSYARSIGLFIDFLTARSNSFLKRGERHQIFESFADTLISGSIKDGCDSDDLWWKPRSITTSKRVLREVLIFTNWLAEDAGVPPVIPNRSATLAEQMTFWHAWKYKKDSSLLTHLRTRGKYYASAETASSVGISKRLAKAQGDIKAFPENQISALLSKGFNRKTQRRWTTMRDQMITLLMHGGGLRLSETLHLWVTDVFLDPEDASGSIVHIFHPSDGAAWFRDPVSGKQVKTIRAHYLRLFHDRPPLTDLVGKKRVGWKDLLLNNREDMYARVFWRSKEYSTAFMRIFNDYMRLRPVVASHPYLFITRNAEPMTIKAFEKVHAAAVRRIGLEPLKGMGTTPHGHRHAYGTWLHENGVDPKVIQIAMHHKGITSQEVYKELSIAKVSLAIDQILINKNDSTLTEALEVK